jgi:type I restriction enzyme R subunit
MKFTEAQLESAIIELLGAEGYPHVLGEAIERQPQEVLIKADLRTFLAKQYAADHITPQEIEAVINRLSAYSAADLYESNKRLESDGFHLKRERTLTPSPSPKGRGESEDEGSSPLGRSRDEWRSMISEHIQTFFKEGELQGERVLSKFGYPEFALMPTAPNLRTLRTKRSQEPVHRLSVTQLAGSERSQNLRPCSPDLTRNEAGLPLCFQLVSNTYKSPANS